MHHREITEKRTFAAEFEIKVTLCACVNYMSPTEGVSIKNKTTDIHVQYKKINKIILSLDLH